ncbi:MAG: MFS transporter [Candidatus Bathyarchaeia archaeon]
MSSDYSLRFEIVSFWKRQRRDWKVIVTWRTFNRFFDRLTEQYASIYIMSLGADPVQLGSVNSIAALARTMISVPIGWLHDKYSLRKILLTGIGLLAIVPLIYGLSPNWFMIIPAILLAQIAGRAGDCGPSCDVCLEDGDRATGRAFCEGLTGGFSIIAPVTAASLIALLGGMNVDGIRPLYYIQFAARLTLFVFVFLQITEIRGSNQANNKSNFVEDFGEVFKRGIAPKRWIAFWSIGTFTTSMMAPFRYPFAYEIKGADEFIIGWMASSAVLLEALLGYYTGRLADRIGRKKIFYVMTPLFCLSNLLLVLSPSPLVLILSGALSAFRMLIHFVVEGVMRAELVPIDCIGRWRAILLLFGGLTSIPAPFLGGIFWRLDPSYVFLIPTSIELLIRVPLLATIPETRQMR